MNIECIWSDKGQYWIAQFEIYTLFFFYGLKIVWIIIFFFGKNNFHYSHVMISVIWHVKWRRMNDFFFWRIEIWWFRRHLGINIDDVWIHLIRNIHRQRIHTENDSCFPKHSLSCQFAYRNGNTWNLNTIVWLEFVNSAGCEWKWNETIIRDDICHQYFFIFNSLRKNKFFSTVSLWIRIAFLLSHLNMHICSWILKYFFPILYVCIKSLKAVLLFIRYFLFHFM